MGAALIPIIAASTILSASSAVSQGMAAKYAGKFNAGQEEVAGRQSFAAGQRRAWQETRQGKLVSSRAQAVSAASGAGAGDESVVDIEGRIGAQTEYNALSSLYEGAESQRGMSAQASLDRAAGSNAQSAGFINAGTTLLSGGASIYDKYGGGGFSKFNSADAGASDLPRYG